MQISSIIQPAEIQSADFKQQGSHAVEKVGNRKAAVQELPQKGNIEQTEKFQELQSLLEEHNISLSFTHDDETNEIVVKMIDNKTGEAINQFPSEVSLKLATVFAKLQGQFVNEKY